MMFGYISLFPVFFKKNTSCFQTMHPFMCERLLTFLQRYILDNVSVSLAIYKIAIGM